jgi:hypothetical protein
MFVTLATVEVWIGVKSGGNDPTDVFTRIRSCDPLTELKIEAC